VEHAAQLSRGDGSPPPSRSINVDVVDREMPSSARNNREHTQH